MSFANETAGPIGTGGEVEIDVALSHYPAPFENATDLAAALISARFGFSRQFAHVVCELAGLGGR